uniref:J domain-containing protein n=1 Tax=Ostreococcus mediterraneus TaxID=1486918 RepID=A0A6T5SWC4_9CHLO
MSSTNASATATMTTAASVAASRARATARTSAGARAMGVRVKGLAQREEAKIVDFYELLGVSDDADLATIKRAYYSFAMECHPDVSGDEEGHDMCVLLNEAYAILKNPELRALHDADLAQQREDDEDGFTGVAYSKWTTRKAKPGEDRAVFVDEFTCIGCKQCVWQAPATFRMNEDYGRSRVFAQWLNTEDDIQCAIDSCPVDCIHWVKKEQLPFLEHVTVNFEKVSVGIMQSQTGNVLDPFEASASFMKQRQRKIDRRAEELAEERRRMSEAEKTANVSESQKRAYRKSADAIRTRWTERTGVAFDRTRRRSYAKSRSTIPLERSVVIYDSPGSRDDMNEDWLMSYDEDDEDDYDEQVADAEEQQTAAPAR